jgi:hypothetical protein
VKNGFYYLPLRPNSKLAAIKDYPTRATNNRKVVDQWKKDGYGLGISTSKYAEDKHLVVVDVDNKNGKDGDAEILKLEVDGKEFPDTYTQVTPTGGRHLVYWSDFPVKQGANVLGPGLDIRAKGGYVVASGTTIDGQPYIDNGMAVQKCPQWILDACGPANEREPNAGKSAPVEIDLSRAIGRAREYLETEAPLAKAGEGGDQTTFKVAARLKDFGVDEDIALSLMAHHWNQRCDPPWSNEELIQKIQNAYRYGVKQIGAEAPEVIFDTPIEGEKGILSYEQWLEEMNKEYAFVTTGNGHRIIWEKLDGKGKLTVDFLPEATFLSKFRNSFAPQSTKGRIKTKAEAWLEWPGRRQYNGIGFFPAAEPRNNYYNLWRGFACEPVAYEDASPDARRGFELFQEHALKNVCAGNSDHFIWLMGYFAQLVQTPSKRPLTTLVFKGRKGTGKNTLVDRVGNLFPAHYFKASSVRYLISNFNAHLEHTLLLLLDEAFWSGDKSAEGKLKSLTTDSSMAIERKGMESYMADNYVRIVVIGNEDWLVPASVDERRYAVFEVGEGRRLDGRFFSDMETLIDEKGGNSVLLHYLQHFDLSLTNPNVAPKTDALAEQKEASLTPLQQWWFDCLQEGRVAGAFAEGWPTSLAKGECYEAFERVLRQRQVRGRIMPLSVFARYLHQMCGQLKSTRPTAEGHRVRCWELPTLNEARQAWDKFIGHKTKWNDEDDA